jgi:hypothetical protein
MTKQIITPATIELESYQDINPPPGGVNAWVINPEHTDELKIAVYQDESDTGTANKVLELGRLQVQLQGTSRALDEFGRFLISLARLETNDTDPHNHLEDVQYEPGGTVHLIVRRVSSG